MAIVGRTEATLNPYVSRMDRLSSTRGLSNGDFASGNFTLGRSNVVTQLPVLPYPLYVGKVSWQEPFNGNTSGSIEYEEVPLNQFQAVLAAYPNGTRVDLYGIPFEVVGTQWEWVYLTPDQEVAPVEPIFYRVAVQLEGLYKDIDKETQALAEQVGFISYPTGEAVKLDGGKKYGIQGSSSNPEFSNLLDQQNGVPELNRSYSISINDPQGQQNLSGSSLTIINPTESSKRLAQASTTLTLKGWTFPNEELLSFSGSNPILDAGYNEAELTWDQPDSQDKKGQTGNDRTLFVPKEPLIEEFVEKSKDFDLVPENTYVLRDTSSNFDETGDKKVYRRSININGKPDREIVITKGLSYMRKDLINEAEGDLINRNPQQFWTEIEYRDIRYIYKKAGTLRLSFNFLSPDGESVTTVVHPDYQGYPNVSIGGGQATMNSNAEYLVEKNTTGWMLARLKKEDDNRNSVDEDDPWYPFFFPKQIALDERTVYELRSARGLFGEKVEPPFTVSYSNWQNLDDRIRQAIGIVGVISPSRKGKVAIVTPNLNYVEPLYIAKEISYSNSFDWANDPDADEPDPDKFIPGTDRVLPPARFKTGQESYNEVIREIRKPDFNPDGTVRQRYYSEQVKSWSSSDPGFDNSIEQILFRDAAGDPPSADYRIQEYESVPIKTDPNNPMVSSSGINAQAGALKYYITTPDNADRIEPNGSASASGAKNLSDAIDKVALDLRLDSMSTITSEVELRGFYPGMRCGQPLNFPRDREVSTPKGTWRITNVSHQLNYQGLNDDLGLLVTHEPTSVSRGLDLDRPIVVTSRPNDENNQSGDNGGTGDPSITVSLLGGVGTISGSLLPGLETRRNF